MKLARGHVVFRFRGKHGAEHHIDLADRKLATVVEKCQALPGQDLFQFLNHDGVQHHIVSDDVNDYLREASDEEITAKDFRTWAATNLAAIALADMERFDTAVKTKRVVVEAVEHVAKKLENTPAICRRCYIHPIVFVGCPDGSLAEGLKARADAVLEASAPGLTAEEVAVTAFLSRRLGRPSLDRPMIDRRRATLQKTNPEPLSVHTAESRPHKYGNATEMPATIGEVR